MYYRAQIRHPHDQPLFLRDAAVIARKLASIADR